MLWQPESRNQKKAEESNGQKLSKKESRHDQIQATILHAAQRHHENADVRLLTHTHLFVFHVFHTVRHVPFTSRSLPLASAVSTKSLLAPPSSIRLISPRGLQVCFQVLPTGSLCLIARYQQAVFGEVFPAAAS